jgi:hypothetical protein
MGPPLPSADFTVTAVLGGHAPDAMATGIPWESIAVPEPGWVRVSVEGGISLDANPAYLLLCAANDWSPCPPRYLGPVGPDGVDVGTPGRPLSVVVRSAGERYAFEHRFPAYGTAVYTYVERGGALQVMRTPFPAARYCLSEPYCGGTLKEPVIWEGTYPLYQVSGAQTVRVEAVPEPLRVSGPTRTVGTEPVTYTATGEIPMRDGSFRWYYVPDDTAPEPLNPRDLWTAGVFQHGCYDTTCTYTPGRSGRMYVTAVPTAPNAGVEARAASPVLALCLGTSPGNGADSATCDDPREPSLTLACAPAQVERGQTISCTAETTPRSARAEDFAWSFDGSGFSIRPGSWTSTPGYGERQRSSRTWTGALLVDGQVTVSATVNGKRVAAAPVQVRVSARRWTQRPLPDVIWMPRTKCWSDSGADCILAYPPVRVRDLGRTRIVPAARPFSWSIAQSGPNEGLYFILGDEALFHVAAIEVYLNPVFDEPDHPYWRSTRCTLPVLLDHVRGHELAHVAIAERTLVGELAMAANNEAFVRVAPRSQSDPAWQGDLLQELGVYYDAMRRWMAQIGDPAHLVREAYPLQGAFPCNPSLRQEF